MTETTTLAQPRRLDQATSQRMRFFGLLAMVLLVYVHGYNLKMNYLQPFTLIEEHLTFTTFFEYLVANGLVRFRIPVLFAISGFLYAMTDQKSYKDRSLKRLRTLGIPYLLWSAVGLLVTYLWELSPVLRQSATSAMLKGDQVPVADYSLERVLGVLFLDPIPFQLWFIRSLLLLNLLYPAIRWVVLNWTRSWFITMSIWWVIGIAVVGLVQEAAGRPLPFMPPAEVEGILFFSVGIWMQKRDVSLYKVPLGWPLAVWAGLWLAACFGKTFLAFVDPSMFKPENMPQIIARSIALLVLHKVAIFAGLVSVWYGMRNLADRAMRVPAIAWACGFAFVIYGLHEPLLHYATNLAFEHLSHVPNYRLLVYLLLPTAIVLVCIGFGAALRAAWPKGYAVLTGGRGLG